MGLTIYRRFLSTGAAGAAVDAGIFAFGAKPAGQEVSRHRSVPGQSSILGA